MATAKQKAAQEKFKKVVDRWKREGKPGKLPNFVKKHLKK